MGRRECVVCVFVFLFCISWRYVNENKKSFFSKKLCEKKMCIIELKGDNDITNLFFVFHRRFLYRFERIL